MRYLKIKRFFDFLLALLGIFIFAPAILLISSLLFINEGPPIFYFKKSLGKEGARFNQIKFRTMYRDSTRITRIGFFLRQTALDELPQLINILKGEMSFIGPRSYGIDKYSLSDGSFFHRLEVKPGLTGLAQVFAPKYAKNDTVFELDKRYIKTQCLLLDLYIICLSLWITVFGRWENATRKL